MVDLASFQYRNDRMAFTASSTLPSLVSQLHLQQRTISQHPIRLTTHHDGINHVLRHDGARQSVGHLRVHRSKHAPCAQANFAHRTTASNHKFSPSLQIDWVKLARIVGFKSAAAARAFHATLGEDKPGGNFHVTRLDIATIEPMFDFVSVARVDWQRLADRSHIGDVEATKAIFFNLAAFEAEMSWDPDSDDSDTRSDGAGAANELLRKQARL
ncbi:hypothetical protein PG988_011654 [Apiospora saccharicola]